ncbi:MAG: hypothetical protein OHK0053_16250 [Microscillaceae bacterium]
MKDRIASNREEQVAGIQSYYAFQAKIYDATRWTFLYGRQSLLQHLPLSPEAPARILEVGCGTGVNLRQLGQKFPHAELFGLDVSRDMLVQARKNCASLGSRLQLIEAPYEKGDRFKGQMDLILFSYSLTMINPQWKELLEQVPHDLKPGGIVAVVDFHKAHYHFYYRFMRSNHVCLDGHLVPYLMQHFDTQLCRVKPGLANVWSYFMYIGGRPKV